MPSRAARLRSGARDDSIVANVARSDINEPAAETNLAGKLDWRVAAGGANHAAWPIDDATLNEHSQPPPDEFAKILASKFRLEVGQVAGNVRPSRSPRSIRSSPRPACRDAG